jgi:uncharacterized membrane protein
MDYPSSKMNARKIAAILVLVALATGTSYAMMPLYNIKLMDIIVFLGGFLFGPLAGGLIGILSWSVYGTLNPLGFSLPIWLATMFSESIYGVAGGAIGKLLTKPDVNLKSQARGLCVFFGALGLLLTLSYDVVTNIVFGYVNNWSIFFSVLTGFIPFGLAHELSNAFFFGVGCVPAISALLKTVGGKTLDVSEK